MTLFVKYNWFTSREFIARSVVPQRSILGPFLFKLYTNDVVNNLRVNYLLHADNLKLYSMIESQLESSVLQDALDRIKSWSGGSNLVL